jgi:Ohr subfamily peroxiredoxin
MLAHAWKRGNTRRAAASSNTLYTATATATAGRDGKVLSDDGAIDLGLAVPKGLGGPGGAGTNPEQLFAAGYAACFGSALKLVAGMQKIVTGPVHITAKVSIGKTDAGGYGLAVTLEGKLPEVSREVAEGLMKAAHQVCPYSNATRGNVEVTLSVA